MLTNDIAHASTGPLDIECKTETLAIFESPEARAISGRYGIYSEVQLLDRDQNVWRHKHSHNYDCNEWMQFLRKTARTLK